MRIFLSTGEPSGDLHAANLIVHSEAPAGSSRFVGFGGPRMPEAGGEVLYPLVDLAVMWFSGSCSTIRQVHFKLLDDAETEFLANRPDAVVLIDYPGFHCRPGQAGQGTASPSFISSRRRSGPGRGWRVEKVKKSVDHVLCSLPFEPDWYRERRASPPPSTSGTPTFDELSERDARRPLHRRAFETTGSLGGDPAGIADAGSDEEPADHARGRREAGRRSLPDGRFAIACLHAKHRDLALIQSLEQTGLAVDVERPRRGRPS